MRFYFFRKKNIGIIKYLGVLYFVLSLHEDRCYSNFLLNYLGGLIQVLFLAALRLKIFVEILKCERIIFPRKFPTALSSPKICFMTKEEIIKNFNPNDPGNADAGIFGLPFNCEQSDIVLIPVPWEATVSYGSGAAHGPKAIFDASFQLDLSHFDYPELWKKGIAMDEIPNEIARLSADTRKIASKIIDALAEGIDPRSEESFVESYKVVNTACQKMNSWVKTRAAYWTSKGKMVGLIGGDHSTPLGHIQNLAEVHQDFGLLVIDAHLDLRKAFEGFEYSHASIFYNALKLPQISRLVQLGIRDFCEEETEFIESQGGRVKVYYDRAVQRAVMSGTTWKQIFEEIIQRLPQKVYVSVDIDGLDPKLCPNTGTPVPGGIEFEQLAFLLHLLKESGKTILGFDLCEVAPGKDDWDGNVGARVLYQLCGLS
jgi:agmatinase